MTTSPVELAPADRELLEQTAERIVRARMAVPVMMFLETVTPMNMVSSSMLRVMSPAWRSVVGESRIDRVAELLERREVIPEFTRIIDTAEEARRHSAQEAKRGAKAAKALRRSGTTGRTPT